MAKKKKQISDNGLIMLSIAVFFISIIATVGVLSPTGVTGFTATERGFMNVTVRSIAGIVLLVDSINFTLDASGTNDTTLASGPGPIIVENNGSVAMDVNFTSNRNWSNFWTGSGETYLYLQYNCTNETTTGARNGTCTNCTAPLGDFNKWCNISLGPGQDYPLVENMNNTDASDTVNMNMRVIAPADETSGKRNLTLAFTATAS